MFRDQIKHVIESRLQEDGQAETGIPGVQLFRTTKAMPCIPAVYEPCIVAIVSGSKEAVLKGAHFVYDATQYLCCPVSMPVKAGTPNASADTPLLGVLVALDPGLMREVVADMEAASGTRDAVSPPTGLPSIHLANWDKGFSDALLRLVQLSGRDADVKVLGKARLRELYFAILKGQAGQHARAAFGPGNAIAWSISQMTANIDAPLSIDEMAKRAGMSRAAFHRKFKQATTLSPIQFAKAMRLNTAAMKIAGGMTVSQAAADVGYVSPSQFSREFKRAYGKPPKRWKFERT